MPSFGKDNDGFGSGGLGAVVDLAGAGAQFGLNQASAKQGHTAGATRRRLPVAQNREAQRR